MSAHANTTQVVPALIGTLSTIGGTAIGAPIDRLGFKDCLAILCAGAVQGSTGSTVNLAIKFQESATPSGTGALWSDITNEAYSASSFNMTTLVFGNDIAGGTTTGTWIPYQSVKKIAKLSDGNRQRYIRAHATLSGTVGIGPKFAVVCLLDKADDTYYVTSAVTVPSGNVELTKLL